MTERDFQPYPGPDLGTDETCPGCDGEVVLVTAEDETISAQCSCSAASVLVAA